MHERKHGRVAAVLGALTLLCAAGCAADKNIDVTNNAEVAVTVRFDDEDLAQVTAGGGVSVLDATDCFAGPIVVTYDGGRVIEVEGPLCPGETLVVSDTKAVVVQPTTTEPSLGNGQDVPSGT